MAYDLASRQSRIPFAVQQKQETVLPSFGEKLRLERERRKITLEQISVSTKIGTRMLEALEEDKFNQLPGGIFNKGFVRAYSRCIGLDEDQTVAEYLQASGDAPPVSTEIAPRLDETRESAENISRLEAISEAPGRQLPWGLFAAVLLVIALALSLWRHRQNEHAKQSVRPLPVTAVAQLRGTASAPGVVGSAGGSAKAGDSTLHQAAGVQAPEAVSPSPSLTATAGEFQVVIRAREESWIRMKVDGKTGMSETLAAGSERTLVGQKEIIVKVGNAGGVDFHFNGKKLNIGGEPGEVKTITFGVRGLLPNAVETPSTP
jgi:cytoskeleton protein RodZ